MLTEHQLRAMPLGQNSSSQGALSFRPNPAHRPKVGGRLLSFPAQVSTPGDLLWSWGRIIGPRYHECPQWWCGKGAPQQYPGKAWLRVGRNTFLEGRWSRCWWWKDTVPLCPCDCDSAAHRGLFALSPLKTSAQDGPWGGQLGAGSCAVFWNLLRHRAKT